jgi:ureidoacrylate peracid hydrolase
MAGATTATKAGLVRVAAEPGPLTIDPVQTALIVVDMQNDFGSDGGMFQRAGIDISPVKEVVEPIRRVLTAARGNALKIVYLKMGFRPDLQDAGPAGAPNRDRHLFLGVGQQVRAPDGSKSRILIQDHWSTEILPELAPEAGELQLYKHRFSGFFETGLDAELRRSGIRYLIVTGCTTSVCVESTVRDAMFRDYSCLVLSDCCAEPIGHQLSRSNHEASLLVIQTLFGWVSRSDAFIEALSRVK